MGRYFYLLSAWHYHLVHSHCCQCSCIFFLARLDLFSHIMFAVSLYLWLLRGCCWCLFYTSLLVYFSLLLMSHPPLYSLFFCRSYILCSLCSAVRYHFYRLTKMSLDVCTWHSEHPYDNSQINWMWWPCSHNLPCSCLVRTAFFDVSHSRSWINSNPWCEDSLLSW